VLARAQQKFERLNNRDPETEENGARGQELRVARGSRCAPVYGTSGRKKSFADS